ncbi:MAG: RNA polymerase sigma factor RpoE [Magnetococcales bacterium]|nr:RNA polymerase sigma factor RpoE [Magnetococcales bacterium]
MSDADALLVKRSQKGDKRAFEILVRRYQGRVASVVSRLVSDPQKVQDLTQESFLKAYRALTKFRGDASFYTWIYRIAINTAKNHLLSKERTIPISNMELEDADRVSSHTRNSDTPEQQLLRSEMMDVLQAVLEELSPTMKRAILLRDLEGLTYEEIAEVMECPIGTVRSRIFRGRQEIIGRMRKYMGSGGKGAPEPTG